MAILVTENWSARKWQPGASASRQWLVSGADSEQQAIDAVPEATEGASYPSDSMLLAEAPSVEWAAGVNLYRVDASYAAPDTEAPDSGGGIGAATWEVGFEFIEEQADTDANNLAILNTAGEPFDPPPTRLVPIVILRVSRMESTFEVARTLAFANTVNAGQVVIPTLGQLRGGTVGPDQMLCVSIAPEGAVSATTRPKPIRIIYEFRLRRDGWRWRTPNVGMNGWSADNGKAKPGAFYASGKPYGRPVRLDRNGKPMKDGFTVNNAVPINAPAQIQLPPVEETQDMLFLRYAKYPAVDYAGLTLF